MAREATMVATPLHTTLTLPLSLFSATHVLWYYGSGVGRVG